MIISRTPFRISLFGGGTDYPAWYRERGGAVLVTTMNKYCYLSCRWLPPFFDYASRVVWSQIELVNDASKIQHPVVRETLKFLNITQGVELHHTGDLPARTGLGSSSSFTVGLLHALYGLKGMMPSKAQLARDAIHVEQERLNEHVGCQDQVITAFGGLNRIEFLRDGTFHVSPVMLAEDRLAELQDHLMLFFTGVSRNASEIAAEQIKATERKVAELQRMHQMVDEAIRLLQGTEDIAVLGRLLHDGWQLKKSLTDRISTAQIDEMYDAALRAGAIGGKLLGAGGGGFFLVFARPTDHERVSEALRDLLHVPFRFEHAGSRIIFYEPQEVPERERITTGT
ncbi:MAG: kinase [Candidatus Omnitrophica bacterium]|nr:kinase [Candidatus Omnitrophota bacterium]